MGTVGYCFFMVHVKLSVFLTFINEEGNLRGLFELSRGRAGEREREIERLVGLSLSPSPPLLVSVETKRGRNMVSSDAPPVSALLPPLL